MHTVRLQLPGFILRPESACMYLSDPYLPKVSVPLMQGEVESLVGNGPLQVSITCKPAGIEALSSHSDVFLHLCVLRPPWQFTMPLSLWHTTVSGLLLVLDSLVLMPSLASFSSRIYLLFPSCSPQVHSPAIRVSWKGRPSSNVFPFSLSGTWPPPPLFQHVPFQNVALAGSLPEVNSFLFHPLILALVTTVSGIKVRLPPWAGSSCVETDPANRTLTSSH